MWPAFLRLAKPDTASLSYHGGISSSSGQLAMAGEPSAGRGSDVWGCSGWQLLGPHCRPLLCWVKAQIHIYIIKFTVKWDTLLPFHLNILLFVLVLRTYNFLAQMDFWMSNMWSCCKIPEQHTLVTVIKCGITLKMINHSTVFYHIAVLTIFWKGL